MVDKIINFINTGRDWQIFLAIFIFSSIALLDYYTDRLCPKCEKILPTRGLETTKKYVKTYKYCPFCGCEFNNTTYIVKRRYEK